jgi:hypothetical protein
MKYTQAILGVGVALIAGAIYTQPVKADNAPSCSVLPQSICNSSTTADSNDISKSSVVQILVWVLRIMTGAVGIAAIGALVFAGITYSAAGNNSAQVTKAKTIITDTAIGLIMYGLMFIILNWLIPGGIFG